MSSNQQHEPEAQYGQYDLGLKSLIRSLQIAFFVMAALIVGLLIFFFVFGGFKIVKPQEEILVLQFGKVTNVLKNDWYWVFPRPINQFVTIPTNAQSFGVTFEAQRTASEAAPGMAEQGNPELSPGRDNYLLTGDANIIHTSWEVVYRITNPQRYYESVISAEVPFMTPAERKTFEGPDLYPGTPQQLLQNVLRNVVIKVTATQKVENALYRNKQAYITDVESQFTQTVAKLDIGIAIQQVTAAKAPAPPLRTKQAFDEVIQAGLEKAKMIDEAEAYRVEQKNVALTEKSTILAEAESYRKRVVAEVQSQSIYFDKINTEYQNNPKTVLVSLYNNVLGDVLGDVKDKYVIHKSARGNQEVRLKINPEPREVRKADIQKK